MDNPGTTLTMPARHWLRGPGVQIVNECPFEVIVTLAPALTEEVGSLLRAGPLD